MTSYIAGEQMTLTRYARMVGVSLGTVEKWISGEIGRPQPLHFIRLCRLHGIDPDRPEDLGFKPRNDQPRQTQRHARLEMEDEHMTQLLRRDLLSLVAQTTLGASLAAPVARLLDSVPSAAADVKIGASAVAALQEKRHRIYLGGSLLGGGTFHVRELDMEYQRVAGLLQGTFDSDALQQEAHALAASLTKQLAFECYDLGRHDHARRLWLAALAMSRGADPQIAPIVQGHIIENIVHQVIAQGQSQHALRLLSICHGQRRALTPRLRSMLAAIEAHATASLGDVDETRRLIAYAEDHIDDQRDERDSHWDIGGWYGHAEINGNAGHALVTLASHHPRLADDALARVTASLKNHRTEDTRNKARIQNSLVRLYANLGTADETEAAARAAIDTARGLHSPRITGELVAIRPMLKRWHTRPGITQVDRDIKTLAGAAA